MIPQEPLLPELKDNPSLHDIVQVLVASDEGSLVLTEEQHTKLATLIRGKVDGCVLFRREILSEIERHEEFSAAHTERAKTLKNQLSRFEDYVKYIMLKEQFEKLPGQEFEITLTNPPGALQITGEPDEATFEQLGPELVSKTIKYSWNKDAIKKAIAAGTYFLGNAEIIKNRKPKFDIKKGLKK